MDTSVQAVQIPGLSVADVLVEQQRLGGTQVLGDLQLRPHAVRRPLDTAVDALHRPTGLPLLVTADVVAQAGIVGDDVGQGAAAVENAVNVGVQVLLGLADIEIGGDGRVQSVDAVAARPGLVGMALLSEKLVLHGIDADAPHPAAGLLIGV